MAGRDIAYSCLFNFALASPSGRAPQQCVRTYLSATFLISLATKVAGLGPGTVYSSLLSVQRKAGLESVELG